MGKRGKAPTPAIERIWDMVDSTGECWLYQGGSCIKGGYRLMFSHKEGDQRILKLAHRVVWEAENGPVPIGRELLHLCHTPNCVRPGHVTIGTREENEHGKDPYRLANDRRRTAR